MECDFLHIWNNYSLSFREHLKHLPNVTINQSFDKKRDWNDNKRVWVQHKDDPPREHPLIYTNCSKEEPPTYHHGEHRTDPLRKHSPRFKITNLIPPFKLLGHVFLTKPDRYGNHYKARIMDVIPEHDNGSDRKFIFQLEQCDGRNAVEDIIAYNNILNYVDQVEDEAGEMEWRHITAIDHYQNLGKSWSYDSIWSNVLKPILHHVKSTASLLLDNTLLVDHDQWRDAAS